MQYKKLHYFFYEKPKGLDFSLTDKQVESENKNAHYYSCTDPLTLRKIKNYITKRIKPCDCSFLDIGCGKGVILDYFSSMGFNKLDGLECCKKYCNIAERNLQINKRKNVNIICNDAIMFEKYERYNVYFMYNPFSESVLKEVVSKIENAHKHSHTCAYLIYVFPIFHNVIVSNSSFVLIDKMFSPLTMKWTNVYFLR